MFGVSVSSVIYIRQWLSKCVFSYNIQYLNDPCNGKRSKEMIKTDKALVDCVKHVKLKYQVSDNYMFVHI